MALAADLSSTRIHFAAPICPQPPVAGGDLYAAVQIDDVLAARGGMPGRGCSSGGFVVDDAGGGEPLGQYC